MHEGSLVIDAVVHDDGRLELLNDHVDWPAGEMRVEVRPVEKKEPYSGARALQALHEIWEQNRLAGRVGRTKEEIDEDIRQQRQEWEDRQEALDACRPKR